MIDVGFFKYTYLRASFPVVLAVLRVMGLIRCEELVPILSQLGWAVKWFIAGERGYFYLIPNSQLWSGYMLGKEPAHYPQWFDRH
jgi:hypothetical protein|tara:strand:- start:239 stop:493 length:255 start_codon:yes stop_codon:yes gene_type:complete